ncbi:MAG: bifunctional hydroxymethylpyrimidine kinase/phosphomethylpyrimidine kinase [Slackia sp.]|nr:bifunctional hydroxymethylpyrimidine kinase/phosphomethylpyrimidine kinase [Slackia sp.]
MSYSVPSVVSIAGSDSSGGAGIQADIKTIESMGLFAQTVITALTAQNTLGVYGVVDVDPDFVGSQIDAVFSDIRPDAVKIGMVSSADIVSSLVQGLKRQGAENIVLDPVMVSTSGSALIGDDAKEALIDELFPLASVITPNIPEAQVLCGMEIRTHDDMERAARLLGEMTPAAVLVKGGHGASDADDVLLCDGSVEWLRGDRVETANTHGTGCTLSSAIACGLASGRDILEAAQGAKRYIAGALAAGFDIGKGSGPLDHMWEHRLNG